MEGRWVGAGGVGCHFKHVIFSLGCEKGMNII